MTELAAQSLATQLRLKRSEMMLSELEAVALQLFEERGFDAATVEEITGRAHLSVRTFHPDFAPAMLAGAVGGVIQAAHTRWYLHGGDLPTSIAEGLEVLERGIGPDPTTWTGSAQRRSRRKAPTRPRGAGSGADSRRGPRS